ncbi:MAG: S8 family peptidase [Bacteroidota bacterium]
MLHQLRKSSLVRYVEPLSYDKNLGAKEVMMESSSGCGSNTPDYDIRSGVHYSTIAPDAKQSWNYTAHGISLAWGRTTGKGIKVYVIDSGCSWSQDNLGLAFNSGASYGRTLERIVTLPRDTWLGFPIGSPETSDDGCGHGTSMAGAIAAPRCSDGNTVGIAYNCNLITCRASTDVFLDEAREVKGVVDAFTNAANRSDVRIISMSIGRITNSSYIADAVRYAYGKGKLIFTAAGTSFSWTSGWAGVIFPASMPEIQSVTGVKDLSSLSACAVCHTGVEVDFSVTMERNTDGMHPLTLADAGDWPSTVGGSSVATASMAGMAALVWSRFPTLTRDQMILRLQQYSSSYPYKSTQFGWGRLNVDRATQ